MNENDESADPQLLSVAAAISSGRPVDWSEVQEWPADAGQTAMIAELRHLEQLSRLNDPIPGSWGPFVISGEIGRGSFAVVYRATDPNLQMDLALKVIRPRFPGGAIDPSRALNEARLLAQINHPNVVRVFRAERAGNEVGVAMELVPGHTLAQLVQKHGPRSAQEAMLIGIDICRALQAVHGAQLLHGDIKAHNVMRAEGGRTVVMDFGAGRDLKDETMSARARIAGTPLYLAPEVLAGAPPSPAADIYSVGVLLYYLTTAAYPVEGATLTEVERAHSARTPRKPLRDARPDLPDAFITVVNRALAELPQDRPQSAGELEAELQRALHLVRPRRRAPVVPPWALAAAVAVIAVGAAIAWQTYSPDSVNPNAPLVSDRSAAGPSSASPSSAGPGSAGPSAATTATPNPDTYRIEAAFYRATDGGEEPVSPGARVNPGDKLSLQLRASIPVHVYVVNEDEAGESNLLFPLDGLSVGNPLPAGQRHRLPGSRNGEQQSWQVTTAGGREHLLIFASPEPSPEFERMFAALPRATAGRPVEYPRLSREAVSALRGIGGVSPTKKGSNVLRLTQEFATPLTSAEESVRGVWVRQITLANP